MGGIRYYKTAIPDLKLKELEDKIELYNKPGTLTLLKKDIKLTNGKGIMRAGNIIFYVSLNEYNKETDICNLRLSGVYLFDEKENTEYVSDYVIIPANKLDEYLSIDEELTALINKVHSHKDAVSKLSVGLILSITTSFFLFVCTGLFSNIGHDRFVEGSVEKAKAIITVLCIICLMIVCGCLSIIIYRKIMLHKLKRKTKDRLHRIAQDIGVEEYLLYNKDDWFYSQDF